MPHRRGTMLLEIAISVLLVGMLLAMSVQVFGWTARERRAADRRAAALVEAGNQLDQLTMVSWDELTDKSAEAVKLSDEATAILPDAKLEVLLKQSDKDTTSKQITVIIDWLGNHRQREGPVKLTAWVYK